LQKIVDNIVSLAQSRKLPIDKLSISLVDLNQSECCAYAAYQDSEFRYPASIVKLFWLVVLYSQYYYQGIEPNQIPPEKPIMNQRVSLLMKLLKPNRFKKTSHQKNSKSGLANVTLLMIFLHPILLILLITPLILLRKRFLFPIYSKIQQDQTNKFVSLTSKTQHRDEII
jgi:hypothetical protein